MQDHVQNRANVGASIGSQSNPPIRSRKKSSGKASLGNKSMRQTTAVSASQNDAVNNQLFHSQIPHTTSSSIKNQRSSASRNKPNYMQPGIPGASHHSGVSAGSQSFQGANMTQPIGGHGTNITLNFNQINLTTGSNRLPTHHTTVSNPQPMTNQTFSN